MESWCAEKLKDIKSASAQNQSNLDISSEETSMWALLSNYLESLVLLHIFFSTVKLKFDLSLRNVKTSPGVQLAYAYGGYWPLDTRGGHTYYAWRQTWKWTRGLVPYIVMQWMQFMMFGELMVSWTLCELPKKKVLNYDSQCFLLLQKKR